MNSYPKTFTPFLLLISIFSCSKPSVDNDTVIPESPVLIKSITTSSISNPGTIPRTNTFTYDNANRQLTRTTSTGQVIEYTYSTALVTGKSYTNGVYFFDLRYSLNADGLAVHEYEIPASSIEYEYSYNSDKTLATKKIYPNGGPNILLTYFYTNGNADSVRVTDLSNGNWSSTAVFEYYPELQTNPFSTIGQSFFGKKSRNMLKKSIETFISGAILRSDYQYEYDNSGRLIKIITSNSGATSSSIDSQSITYY